MKGDKKLLIAASRITGIVAAGMADGDIQKGAEIAGNATNYNYLAEREFNSENPGRCKVISF